MWLRRIAAQKVIQIKLFADTFIVIHVKAVLAGRGNIHPAIAIQVSNRHLDTGSFAQNRAVTDYLLRETFSVPLVIIQAVIVVGSGVFIVMGPEAFTRYQNGFAVTV